MSVPFWFDANAYVKNKAAAMNMDVTALLSAFKDAGFSTDPEGLYSHFTQFGNAEKVSPNAFFNTDQYLYTKAAKFYDSTQVTDQQAKSMDLAMNQAGMTPWTHYQMFWDENYAKDKTFYNPSSSFDVAKYMNDKLVQMQQGDPTYTMDDLVKAFKDAGLDPVSHYFVAGKSEGLNPENVSGGTPGATYQLSTDDDELYGTSGDDYFHAKVDTLNDRDYIDGGAGNDTLYAIVKEYDAPTSTAVAPEIHNVETVLFRAQANNGSGGGDNNVQAYIDAGNITGMKVLGSDNSRADLSVEDVRIDSNKMTIRFSDTDPGDVDFSVYFDPQHLKSEASVTTGSLNLQLIDTVGALPADKGGHNDALYDNPYTGFKFSLNGKEYSLDFGTYNHTTDSTPTYQELADQIAQAIAKDPELSQLGLTVKLGPNFDAIVGIGEHKGEHVTGQQIILSTPQGELTGGNWIASNGLPPTNSTSATFEADSSTDCPLISTTVELDNVGRVQWDDATPCLPDDKLYGSEAGDLVIGSMAARGGVERFDVKVDEGSWLSSLSSTNNALRYISVEAKDIDGDGSMGGRLFIGDSQAQDAGNEEMAHWTTQARLLATGESSGLTDVKVFDADGYTGDINIAAQITAESNAKYLEPQDGLNRDDSAPKTDDGYYSNVAEHFAYRTGTGDDTINMKVNGGVAADNDFALSIKTGAGNDLVNFSFEGMTARESVNQKVLQNVTIDTGDGNDAVWFWGGEKTYTNSVAADAALRGSVVVNAGAGNDVIYANQKLYNVTNANGSAVDFKTAVTSQAVASDSYNAVFVFNAGPDGADKSMLLSGINGAQSLNNDVLGSTGGFAYTGATAGKAITLTVTFKGIEAKVDVTTPTAATGAVTAEEVNQAIIKAINNDPVLSKLLVAKDGAGHSLIVESLINGHMDLGDLGITFNGGALNLGGAYDTAFGTIEGTGGNHFDLTGSDSTASQAVVNGGAGDDVIVLGPNNHQSDIVVLENNFGNDILVGFVTGEDKINVNALGIKSGFATISNPAANTAVGNNMVVVDGIGFAHAPGNTSGIYTVEEAKGHFTGAFTGTSIIAIKDMVDNLYTFFKVVDGAWTLLGSADTADGTIDESDFTVSNDLAPVVGTIYNSADYHAAASAKVDGTTDADFFHNLSTLGLGVTVNHVDGLAGSDTFNVDGALADLTIDGGTGKDTLNINAPATDDVVLTALNDVETINVEQVKDLTFTAMSTDMDTTMTVAEAANVDITSLTGTHDVTIDASGATGTVTIDGSLHTGNLNLAGGAGADVLTSGKGADIFTGGAGADKFVFATGSGNTTDVIDTITDFVSGTDSIKLDAAGAAANTTIVDGSAMANLTAVVTAANTAFDTTIKYYVAWNVNGSGDGYLVVDYDADGSADQAIELTGVSDAAHFAFGDIVNA